MLHKRDEVYESVFAPDGSSIFIAGGDALITRLGFDAATGTVRGEAEIIPVPGVPGVRGLSISRDGARLAFAGLGLSSQIWAQPVRADGSPAGEARALTSDTSRRNSVPVISPDGTRVAYMSSRRGESPNLWMMDADGRHPLQLTSDSRFESQPEWSSDGSRIVYLDRGGNDERVLAIDVATRSTTAIVPLAALRPSAAAPPIVASASRSPPLALGHARCLLRARTTNGTACALCHGARTALAAPADGRIRVDWISVVVA